MIEWANSIRVRDVVVVHIARTVHVEHVVRVAGIRGQFVTISLTQINPCTNNKVHPSNQNT